MGEVTGEAAPRYDRVRFVMGETGDESTGVLDSLYARGMRKAVNLGKQDRLFDALDAEICDVLMYDYDLLSKDFVDVMQRIRRKVHGKNPFLIIIATVRDSAFDTVRQLISAGVDDLIRKPVSIDRLFESLNTFTQKRKPFVVSYDYVGPTRRLGRRGSAGSGGVSQSPAQLIRVPNTLRSRAVEGVSDAELEQIVNNAVASIEEKRLESYGIELDILSHRIVETYATPVEGHEDVLEFKNGLRRIEMIADDLRLRCRGTSSERVGDLATMLIAICQRIINKPIGRATIEVQLLEKLAVAIRRAVSVERHSVRVMQEIAATIAKYSRTN